MARTPSLVLLFLLLPFLSFAAVRFRRASTGGTALSWSNGITLLGDATIKNGSLSLTTAGAGRALHSAPVRLLDPITLVFTSFRTHFTFFISAANLSADGLAFLLTANPRFLGDGNGYLGLYSSDNTSVLSATNERTTVAVEFDTKFDPHLGDPNGNHIAIDLGSIFSLASADAGSVDLKAGIRITAWIEYNATADIVRVWVGKAGDNRPRRAVLRARNVGLAGHLKDLMYVGFSASCNAGGAALHVVEKWSFRTSGDHDFSQTTLGLAGAAGDAGECVAQSQGDEGPFMENQENKSCRGNNAPSLPPSRSPSKEEKRKRMTPICRAIIAMLIILVAVVTVTWCYLAMKKDCCDDSDSSDEESDSSQCVNWRPPPRLCFHEIKQATKGFHQSKILSRGSAADVYSGVLPSGCPVTVKRFTHADHSINTFASELAAGIACSRHSNIVPLHGWCSKKDELLLVYEQMPNGTLDRRLHSRPHAPMLTWPQRQRIILGLASAVAFLHDGCEKRIIHGHITASNVLLDSLLDARLGDFGPGDVNGDGSDAAILQMGYLAPEYVHTGVATEMSDVYAVGVIALEVATGRRPLDKGVALVDWVWRMYGKGKVMEAADGRLLGEFEEEEMKRMMMVGMVCAHPDSEMRPTMRKAVKMLNGRRRLPVLPKQKPAVMLVSLRGLAESERTAEGSSEALSQAGTAWFTPSSSLM